MTSASPRVEPLPESEWTDAHREALRRAEIDGPPDPFTSSLLRVPELMDGVTPMTRYVTEQSTLAPEHRLLLALRTTWLEGSPALWAAAVERSTAGHSELPEAALEHPDLDSIDHTLLQFADELVLTAAVSDATWARLADGHDTLWMMDAVETVAHHSFLCCLERSFGPSASDASMPVRPDRPTPPHRPGKPDKARIDPIEGDGIAVHRTFARHPEMNEARRPRPRFINHISTLTPHDRETLILRIGWDCRSEYEWAKHVGTVGRARDHGVDPDLIVAGPSAAGVTEHDALLMQLADDLSQHSRVADPTWSALRDGDDLKTVMSSVFSAASYRSTSMSLNAYGVQLEPGDEHFPPISR